MTDNRYYHAHQILHERCKGRLKCLRTCPTKAIRYRHGSATFAEDLCIDCGECLQNCPEHTFVVISDELDTFTHFKYQIALPSPVLYTQFDLGLHPQTIDRALIRIGFDEVADLGAMGEEVAVALVHYMRSHSDHRPLISSYCPSIVRLIQVGYPNLVHYLLPLDVPRELVAREIKRTRARELHLKEEEIGVIYITPCPAKIVSIKQPAEKVRSWIDGAIPIRDIYNLIMPVIINLQETAASNGDEEFHYGKGWNIIGHVARDMGTLQYLSVEGLAHAKIIFDDLERGQLRGCDLIEVMACVQECVGGIFCVENPYIARHASILLERRYGGKRNVDRDEVLQKYKEGFYFLEQPVLPRQTGSTEHDISSAIRRLRQKERIILKLPQKDCCLCGAPDCETFAQDCASGASELSECMVLFQRFTH